MPQKHSGSSQGQSSSNDNEEADGPAPPAPVLPHMAGVASRGPTEGEVGSSITFPGLLGPSIVPPPQSVTGPDGVPLFNEANPPPPAVTAPPVVPTEAPIVMNLGASADTGTTLPTTPDGLSALLQQSDPSGDENKKIDPLGLSLEELENEPELNADDLQVQEKPIFEKKSSETAEGTAEGAPVKAVFAKRKTKVKAPNCRSAV
eukprot:Selendium_serpulae@DN5019_c0_g1_i4.p2